MKPVDFAYARPRGIEEAIAALERSPGAAAVMSGGQSLGAMLNLRLATPSSIVDLGRIESLRGVRQVGDAVEIGAAVTHAEIENGVTGDATRGFLEAVAATIAYRAVRTRGTIGGSLAHADPAADWLTALTALQAELTIVGRRGTRSEPIGRFLRGAFATSLGDDEILALVRVAALSRSAMWSYYKICRKPGEFADAISAIVFDPGRKVSDVVLGAIDAPPVLLAEVGFELASGGREAAMKAAEAAVAKALPGSDDIDRQLYGVAVRRAIERLR